MSVDVGFDFRQTSSYVTDPTNCFFVSGSDAYPTTYGTVSAGYSSGAPGSNARNRSTSVDPRLAGMHFTRTGMASSDFRVDLPNGTYNFYCALGDASNSYHANAVLFDGPDTGTVLFASGDVSVPAGSFVDATGATYTAANWPTSNSPLSITVTQGYVTFYNYAASALTVWAHARFTSTSSGATLTVLSLTQGHSDSAASLTQQNLLAIQNATQGHTDSTVALTQASTIAISPLSQGHTDSTPTLSTSNTLSLENIVQGHADSVVALTQAYTLAVLNLAQGHTDQSATLTSVDVLTIQNLVQGHADQSPALVIAAVLGAVSVQQGHAGATVTLIQASALGVEPLTHSHTDQPVTLSLPHTLIVEGITQGHITQVVTLQSGILLVMDPDWLAGYVDREFNSVYIERGFMSAYITRPFTASES